jgi:hypothetical protein
MMDLLVSEDKYQARIKICESCEMFKPQSKRCGVCNCIMPLKARLLVTLTGKAECPHPKGNKWEIDETNTSTNSNSVSS